MHAESSEYVNYLCINHRNMKGQNFQASGMCTAFE